MAQIDIWFCDLTKRAQKRIVSSELSEILKVNVTQVTILSESGLNPCMGINTVALQQDVRVRVCYANKFHYWLMQWNIINKEFDTCMEYNG